MFHLVDSFDDLTDLVDDKIQELTCYWQTKIPKQQIQQF